VEAMFRLKALGSMAMIMFLLLPVFAVLGTIPAAVAESVEEGWWVDTTVDRDKDGIGDMVELHQNNPLLLDLNGTLPVIVDFDHTPTQQDIEMLEREVDFRMGWDLYLIDALSGRVHTQDILALRDLPGVVMIELDGILEVQMADVVPAHGVDLAWDETGYDGSGVAVAIIDTGIDHLHVGLDDLDDDNSTNDPKVVAFYDAISASDETNGTTEPYDDHGHGSHCGGITAGTGAPDFVDVGIAPQARLVGVKVLDGGGSGSFSGVMGGMQWTVDVRYQYNIRTASMSLGGPGAIEWTSSEEDSVNRMANEMVRAGIALFIAAGNSAVSAQIGTPGSAEDVITVGALDKDTKIAIYSSQGPTEEGRIKPNIAFVGSSVNSVAANSGSGYTSMSGTSMATPGAAGLGALMSQANPDLSPFDIRNIMQETATYRQCHYMGANEPCAEDLIPKNRQNNVYGHGHVNAQPALIEAAEMSYSFNNNLSVNVTTAAMMDNHIHLNPGEHIDIELNTPVDTIQWRSNHLRDNWANLHSYDHQTGAELTHTDITHQLEHLPGIELQGNHSISIRAISGTTSSPLVTVDIMLMGEMLDDSEGPASSSGIGTVAWLGISSFLGVILFTIGMVIGRNQIEEAELVE
jgi:subtilisin family serine protease